MSPISVLLRFLLGLSVAASLIPIAVAQTVNPYAGDPSAIRVGATLFGARCSGCHGADAKGIVAPDLTNLWVNGTDDARAYQVIRNGIPGSVMPPSQAPDNEIWSLVNYLKSINIVPRVAVSNGDPGRGANLFRSQCQACHRVRGDGGSLGPDLSNITRTRDRDSLVSSIREPGLAVARNYRTVSLELGDGTRLRGTLKGEDAFSLQIMDSNQRLRGFMKADLRALGIERDSLMPAFTTQQLSSGDLNDLFFFLDSQNNSDGAR